MGMTGGAIGEVGGGAPWAPKLTGGGPWGVYGAAGRAGGAFITPPGG